MFSIHKDTRISLTRIKYDLRSYLAVYPELFFPFVHLKSKSRKLAVTNRTEIVIEGFPRSGNSFAVAAFRAAQPRSVKIATHLHAPAQIILAARKNIPTLVVIRNPIDAVISLRALDIESHSLGRSPLFDWSSEQLLRSYIRFYTSIIPYQNKYVLGLFEEVTKDFGPVVRKINQRFNTNFSIFSHTENNVHQVFETQMFHAGPSKTREKIKTLLRKDFESESLQPLIVQAKNVHQEFKLLAQG